MNLLLAGGGTGGHLFPGLALAAEIRRRRPDADLAFIGTAAGLDSRLVPPAGFDLHLIAAGRGSPLSLRKPGNAPRFVIALWQSMCLLARIRPQALVALGGFAAAAPGLAAALGKTPIIILEQNAVPGRTNRLLSRWAAQIHLQFPEAGSALTAAGAAVSASGSPIRAEIAALAGAPPVSGDAILVMGGSQGAARLNRAVVAAAPAICAATAARIIHLAGAADFDRVRHAYARAGIEAEVHGFANDMAGLYRSARLAISRAGAGGLAECAAAGLPAILVPLPEAMDDHQKLNARCVQSRGGAVVLDQETLAPDSLARAAIELWRDGARLGCMAACMRSMAKPDAAARIAESLERIAA